MNSYLSWFYVLILGIAAVSFGAIFVRLADAPPPVIASLRMIFSALLLAPWAWRSKRARIELLGLNRRECLLLGAAGSLLALHFFFWITSLSLTGVTGSVVLVSTSPIFVALYSLVATREKVTRVFWMGLGVAVLGSVILGGSDLTAAGQRWKGDMLAVLGSVSFAGYFLIGGSLRKRLSLITYVFPVYSFAAVLLAGTTVLLDIPFAGYGWRSYLYCFGMALVCQVLGHSLFNWALRHLKATVVALGALGEPVGATILAFVILGETPLICELAGGAAILSGIFIVLRFNPPLCGDQRLLG